MNLYELTGQLLELQKMAENDCVDEEILLDTMEGVEGEFDLKIENYCKVIKNLEASSEALKKESDRLKERQKSIDNNIKRMKQQIFDAMKAANKTHSGGDIFKVSIQKNGGKPPIVLDVPDVYSLPVDFIKITESADMDAIREALDAGNCKFAHYGERGESLRIK